MPACAEGAIAIAGGKARLADVLCDGLGACLGERPRGAISMVEREAAPLDAGAASPGREAAAPACPGARPRSVRRGLAVVQEPPLSPPGAGGGRAPGRAGIWAGRSRCARWWRAWTGHCAGSGNPNPHPNLNPASRAP